MKKDLLKLPIKGEWYRKCVSGVKKEEYREIKAHYNARLLNKDGTFRKYFHVELINGYGKKRPRALFECLGIRKGIGDIKMGAPTDEVYIISLGKMVYHTKN
ncbi:ASCH domain-containing protein [Dysgonomonas sp. GY617]|uniref:ASCH domain-containing protein n=1 Tax=Dysgonomonas sp. GY617 TaxID=2780420 RepID=UPI00188470E0|nr:ASCH domain-containing protein [Dysgonomonas sp. GY617]MBF0576618.1 ASCH domain-containing protein [Dysgonomonas sp. GY617]